MSELISSNLSPLLIPNSEKISIFVPVVLWQDFQQYKHRNRFGEFHDAVHNEKPQLPQQDPQSQIEEKPVVETKSKFTKYKFRYCHAPPSGQFVVANGNAVSASDSTPIHTAAVITQTEQKEHDFGMNAATTNPIPLYKKRKVVHNKTVCQSRNSLHQSLCDLQNQANDLGSDDSNMSVANVSRSIQIAKLPPLQLPVRIYSTNRGTQFEGILYDMDEPSGKYLYLQQKTKEGKNPRACAFVRIVKTPVGQEMLQNALFANLSQAAQKTQNSTASGWSCWTVPITNANGTTQMYSLGSFRESTPNQITNGSGFIRSPKATVVWRDVLAKYSFILPKQDPIIMLHSHDEVSDHDFERLTVQQAWETLEDGKTI